MEPMSRVEPWSRLARRDPVACARELALAFRLAGGEAEREALRDAVVLLEQAVLSREEACAVQCCLATMAAAPEAGSVVETAEIAHLRAQVNGLEAEAARTEESQGELDALSRELESLHAEERRLAAEILELSCQPEPEETPKVLP